MKREAYGSSRLLPEDVARRTSIMLGRFSYKDLFSNLPPDGIVFESGVSDIEGVRYKTKTCSPFFGVGIKPSITVYTVDTSVLWEAGRMPKRILIVSHKLEGEDEGQRVSIEAREFLHEDFALPLDDNEGLPQAISGSDVEIIRNGMVFDVACLPRFERKRMSRLFKIK